MLPTAGAFLRVATSYEGTEEHPRGSNMQIFAAMAGHPNGYAWCATFGAAIAKKTGLILPSSSAYCPTVLNAYQLAKRWGETPRVGAQFFIYFKALGGVHHTGFVTAYDANYIWTIEGNSNDQGSREGWEVCRRKRPRSSIYAYGYPVFGQPAHPKPNLTRYLQVGNSGYAVTNLQKLLHITADGDFGPKTKAAVVAFQKKHHLSPDGVVGKDTAHALGWLWKGK